jgi:hypothetical protein
MIVNRQLGRGDHNPGIPISIVVSEADDDFKITWIYSLEEAE